MVLVSDIQRSLGLGSAFLSTMTALHHHLASHSLARRRSPLVSTNYPPFLTSVDLSRCLSAHLLFTFSADPELVCPQCPAQRLTLPGIFSFLPIGGYLFLLWTRPWVLVCVIPEVLLCIGIKIQLHL